MRAYKLSFASARAAYRRLLLSLNHDSLIRLVSLAQPHIATFSVSDQIRPEFKDTVGQLTKGLTPTPKIGG